MVYVSLSFMSLVLFLKTYGAEAQCAGRLELLPQGSSIPSTAYIQPVGQVCFPAVIQIPDANTQSQNNPPSAPQNEDDEYLNLIYLLISALTGSSNKGNCNSNSNTNNNCQYSNNQNSPNTNLNPFSACIPNNGNKNPAPSTPSSGYIDFSSFCNCGSSYPSSNSNQPIPNQPITISIDTSGATTSSICDACNSNNPFANIPFPFCGLCGLGNGPSCGQNNGQSSGNNNSGNNFSGNSNSGNIPDIFNSGSGCIYVPYPVPVPYNVPGYNFNDICYPENEYGAQEINLIIKTECD